ncbi:hypothetical protein F3Y22_tig00112205pilonHSYRG00041 [Hibiscus syriacus]|uniref:Uncharacterized protein n=1 Tax=Hibiscus syriacus TaxID=106335 RepID=A0A6A2X548_HIBSY|nr:hypothetical protein F3Y22_tig00112205pilonHSYRG00041 [Hibiscus syriacus]
MTKPHYIKRQTPEFATSAFSLAFERQTCIHKSCCILRACHVMHTSTSGLLHFPTLSTVNGITNTTARNEFYGEMGAPNPKSGPDPDPVLDSEREIEVPDTKSPLLCGVIDGVATLVVVPMMNFPPCLVLMVEVETVVLAFVAAISSWKRSNRYLRASVKPDSRQASRRPQGFHVPQPGRRISHPPGLDRVTLSEPEDGTNGVTIDAIATGEPERLWIVIDHPFRSLEDCTLSDCKGSSQFL